MSTIVGIWIDHKKAILATITQTGETIEQMDSGVESQPRRQEDTPLHKGVTDHLHKSVDTTMQRTLEHDLTRFYKAVTERLRAAESILILGPGEAKDELKKHLEKHGLAGRISAVETADKMTERQLAARARHHFLS